VVLARHWKVTLDATPLLWRLRKILERMTDNQFSITSESETTLPDYLLVHDRYDGACWLWRFAQGRSFVEAHEPMAGSENSDGASSAGDAENRRLLGP
jgi:hypothetical protein